MEKEFMFEGKKYISAKRAGLIYGYNPDYVGQLCREGVLDGRIVGRSWFVSDEAIKNHKNQIIQKPRNRSSKQTEHTTEKLSEETPVLTVSSTSVSPVSVHVPTFHLSSIGSVDALALPGAEQQQTLADVPIGLKIAFSIMVAIIMSVTLVGVSQPTSSHNTLVDSHKVFASVGAIALDVESRLRIIYSRVASLFTFPETSMPSSGMVVLPQDQVISDTARARVKKYIQESFSDEVDVTADPDATSGIVTPVFKNDLDQSYMYVMVPLKE